MKHVKGITAPKKAEAWWWTIGGVAAGLLIDNFYIDGKVKDVTPPIEGNEY